MTDQSTMKLGKKPPRIDPRTLKLSKYITPKLAPAPAKCNFSKAITTIGMMDNDRIGCCTCAAVGHQIQTWTANSGTEFTLPDADVLKLYENFGYNPSDPSTDQGAVELDVLSFWRKNPVDGHSLQAYATLDPKHTMEARQAIYYFGGSYIGLALPLSAQNQDIWHVTSLTGDGEPGSWGGHAVNIVAYDRQHVTCITWGALKEMSWNFFYAYCEEAYCLLSPDWFCKDGKCPSGFDLAQLETDLAEITS